MARSHLVLDLVEKRVQLQEQLKASLKRQQDMLVTNQLANLNDISGEQIAILEAFQEYETAYRKQLSSYFSDEELANPPLPLSQRLGLSGAEAKSLLRWQEQGFTVVFVSHDLNEVVFLSDRVVFLSEKPTRIARIVEIDHPRPRAADAEGRVALLRLAEELAERL